MKTTRSDKVLFTSTLAGLLLTFVVIAAAGSWVTSRTEAAATPALADPATPVSERRTLTIDHVKWVKVDEKGVIRDMAMFAPGEVGASTCSAP